MQVGTLQAIAHKIELNDETEARRVQAGTLQVIAHKIELDEEKEAGREQVGTLQAIAHKIELNEGKEARRKGRHTPGGRAQDRAERRKGSPANRSAHSRWSGNRAELTSRKRERQIDSGKASKTDMVEPVNAVTPTMETRQRQQDRRQRSRNGNHPETTKGEVLQPPRIRTYQARLHEQ